MSVLHRSEIQALREALDDEYRAWATYDRVIHAVFLNLQRALQEGHLPAFRRCAARGASRAGVATMQGGRPCS